MKHKEKLWYLMRVSVQKSNRRIITLILFFVSLCLSVGAQNNAVTNISLKLDNAPMDKALEKIEELSGYKMAFTYDEIQQYKVTVDIKDKPVNDVMKEVLKGTSLDFNVKGQFITVFSKTGTKSNQTKGRQILGSVVDPYGIPVVGATINVVGSQNVYALTDDKGQFSITIPEAVKNGQLLFSFVGMKSKVEAIGEQLRMDVVLDFDDIGDVVVTGYQEVTKHQIAGSIKNIKIEDIKLGASFSVDQMLSGQVSGVNVMQLSGEPSSTPKIRIRGTSSILGNKAPIWVLDGIILDDPVTVNYQDLTGDDAAYLIGNAIAGVNPSDIETITILKDASATALYGVQAANGVIVVTTKRGESGKTKVRYTGSFSINERPSYSRMNLMNAAERIVLSQEMLADHFTYSRIPDDIGYEALYMNYLNHTYSYDEFSYELKKMASRNTDWYDLLFRDAFSHNHTVSLSGGTDNTNYYASVGYNSSPTTAIKGGSNRFNASMKLNSWVTKKLYLGLNVSGYKTNNKGYSSMAGVNPNSYAQNTARTIPIRNDDGSLYYYKTTTYKISNTDGGKIYEYMKYNILNELNKTGAKGDVSNFNVKLNAQYEFFDGLKYEFLGSIVNNNSKSIDYAEASSYYVSSLRGWNIDFPYLIGDYTSSEWYQESPIPVGGIYSSTNMISTTYTLRNTLRYNKTINRNHVISAFVTSEIRDTPVKGSSVKWYGWQPDRGQTISPMITDKYLSNLNSGMYNPSLTDRATHFVSWLGSFSYSYKNKWTINGNVRMDGSNSFGENPKYRFLPVWSVAGKYMISNEPWLIDNNIISQLAIRASYGIQGNVDPNTSPSLVIKVGGTNSVTGLNESNVSMLPNADLRWEKTKSYNIGLDFAFFDDLVNGTFDIYKKHGTDIISSTQVSAATGRAQLKINSGIVDNSGIELALGIHPFKSRDWDFYMNFNYSYNRNKLIKANSGVVESNSKKINGIALIEGESLGTIYSYQYAGLNSETGYPVFYDKEGNITGLKTTGGTEVVPNYSLFEDELELVKSGVTEPPHFGGMNLTLRWKNLRLSSAMSYSAGAVGRLPSIYVAAENAYYADKNMSKEFINRWRMPGDEAKTDIPVLYNYDVHTNLPQREFASGRTIVKGRDMYDKSTIRVAKTNVLRMRSLELSYNVPTNILQKWGIESATFGLQATNLFFVADKAWGGMDPESGYASVPIPRTYTLNLSLTF